CVEQGVPFAREYGGLLANRSFGGAQVSRTFYARGQTGQQLLLGCYQALCRQIAAGTVQMFPHTEMLDLVIVDGNAKGIITRSLRSGKIHKHTGDAVVLATGGYGNVFYLSTNARGCNVTATYRAYKKGALFANPSFTQIHPTCIPVSGEHQSKLTLMSESLRNDGRVWVPKRKEDRSKPPGEISEADRDYYLERKYPSYGNLAPRDISSRAAKEVCDEGRGVGASGLMQGLADGYFILPYTLPNYLAGQMGKRPSADSQEFEEAENEVRARIKKMLDVGGECSLDSIHRELGLLLWDKCGMSRHAKGLREALVKIPELREKFWREVCVPSNGEDFNQSLERAGR